MRSQDSYALARSSSPLALLALPLLFLLAGWFGVAGTRAPPAAGPDAPQTEFSAARAMDALARILGDEAPHPTGSAANAAVRERVVAELRGLGLDPEVRRRFTCGALACATVDNVLARVPGASPADALLLSAHYDSVAAGPGAGDDGAGVAAILEAARALLAGPPLARDTWLLFNDGEELGLLGAHAFVREPEFARIAHVVNLEARGTTGPSLLIETQDGNAAIARLAGRVLRHPAGSSLEYEVYRTLPNDTDFTVYRREGLAGLNFAWAEGAARYHTPLDNLAHLDPRSLQHHGGHVLSLARAFADAPAPVAAKGDAVFVALPGGIMPGWPVAWNAVLLAAGLLGWLAWGWRLHRAGGMRLPHLVAAAVLSVLALAALVLLSVVAHALLRHMGAMPAAWTAQGGVLVACFLVLAPGLLVPAGRAIGRACGTEALALASLVPLVLVALAATLWMPGAAHLGLLPLLAAVLPAQLAPRHVIASAGLAAVAAAVLYAPYALGSYDALGHEGLLATPLLAGIALLPLLPALVDGVRTARVLAIAAWAAVAALALVALSLPAFDAHVPRQVNLLQVDDGNGARVFVAPRAVLPVEFRHDAGLADGYRPLFPWGGGSAIPGPAAPRLPSPVVTAESHQEPGGHPRARVRVRSVRGAGEIVLVVPGTIGLSGLRVDGEPLAHPPRHADPARWSQLRVISDNPDGVLFEFDAPAAPATLYAFDRDPGLSAELDPIRHTRDAIGMPVGNGDASLALTPIPLLPQP
ncbi:M28 family peptidase [Lysobacter sp. GX 14042]|uniref:M28 family peptidase n=1 Tax=Lysobacter sp. GX 14042 TaxID=2907155 RepID=UPI001F2F5728|nr:M28 family peptidase [Lysobacter sp. GX 14042]MCE7033184.1 M28 family peptidase [Lysobacter sp. GX 14042]